MILYESKGADIMWDDLNKIVVGKFKGYSSSKQFREIQEKLLESLKAKKCTRYLADVSNFMTLTKEDEAWINNEWFPRVIQNGLKKLAMVQPGNIIQKKVASRIVSVAGMETCEFSSYEEALVWIKK